MKIKEIYTVIIHNQDDYNNTSLKTVSFIDEKAARKYLNNALEIGLITKWIIVRSKLVEE